MPEQSPSMLFLPHSYNLQSNQWNYGQYFMHIDSKCQVRATFVTRFVHLRNDLRIPDSYHAKTLKNHTPLVCYASYFCSITIRYP